MNDQPETKRIEAVFGPLAGSLMDIPTADADAAIADGWARDPYAPPPSADEPVKEFDAAAHDQVLAAAEAAARKIRGEDTEDDMKAKKGSAKKTGEAKSSDANADTQAAVGKVRSEQMEAQPDDGGYETRQTRKPKK